MKKLSILFIGLLLVTGFAFADGEFDGTPTTDIDITASVTWGVDLNTNATGFKNEATFDAELTWLNEVDFSKAGDDGLYGSISVVDVVLKVDTAGAGGPVTLTRGAITAKVVVDPMEIKIYAAPGFAINKATQVDATTAADVQTALANVNGTMIGGITITLPVDPITVALKVASDGDWTENVDNEYVIGSDITLEVDPIELGVALTYGWLGAPQVGIGVKADVALDVADGIDAYVAFDANIPDGGDLAWDAAVGFTFHLSEANADDDTANVGAKVYVAPFGTDQMDLDVALTFAEPEVGGLMDMLYASATVQLLDLLETLAWNVDVSGGYDTGSVDPYFGFGYGSDEIFDLNVGVHLKSGLTGIDLTTITLDYVSTDLSVDNGIFTVKTAIAF